MNKLFQLTLDDLLVEVRKCRICEDKLPLGPRPILQAAKNAKLLIVGQAPGAIVHATGIAWDDKSGERLRSWIGIDNNQFYDPAKVALIPVGFCYPGRGLSGDLPPRPECAATWLEALLQHLPDIQLTLLVGQYAQRQFLGARRKATLTETVKAWAEYSPQFIPLPHPSPRNFPWIKQNEWFEMELVPQLKKRILSMNLNAEN